MTLEFKYGLGLGSAVCAWILLQYALGLHTSHLALGTYAGYVSNLIPALALFFLLRKKQREHWDHTLTLGRGIFSGMQAAFVAALVVYCFLTIYHHFINPEWIDSVLEWKVAEMRAAGRDELLIREHILNYREAYSPLGLARSTIIGLPLLGGVLALVITLTFRVLPKPPTPTP